MKVDGLQIFNLKRALPKVFLLSVMCDLHAIFCASLSGVKKGLLKAKISLLRELITRKSNVQSVGNKWSGDLTREITTIRQPIVYSGFHFLSHNLLCLKKDQSKGYSLFLSLLPPLKGKRHFVRSLPDYWKEGDYLFVVT